MPATDAILFVDDDDALLRATSGAISRRFPEARIQTASSSSLALQTAGQTTLSAAVIDLELDPGNGPYSGFQLLTDLLEQQPHLRIIVVTGHSETKYGIEAMKRGASSFISKPASYDHLYYLLLDALEQSRLRQQLTKGLQQTSLTPWRRRLGLATNSPVMELCLEEAAFAASTRQPLLILGQTGTGKSMLARAIHTASDNAGATFVHYQPNFGSADLINSELFGHERGAFTGAHEKRTGLIEEADGGTLFIDEVDELPQETQIRILHVLQEGVFRPLGGRKDKRSSFRLLAATNRNIEESLASGKLREDFFHRIAHHVITIPPLRERTEDILILANNYLAQSVEEGHRGSLRFDKATLEQLVRYPWPGNVRELLAVIGNALAKAQYEGISLVLPKHLALRQKNGQKALIPSGGLRDQLQTTEKQLIADALRRAQGNQSEAARLLKIERASLRRLATKYQLI